MWCKKFFFFELFVIFPKYNESLLHDFYNRFCVCASLNLFSETYVEAPKLAIKYFHFIIHYCARCIQHKGKGPTPGLQFFALQIGLLSLCKHLSICCLLTSQFRFYGQCYMQSNYALHQSSTCFHLITFYMFRWVNFSSIFYQKH